MSRKLGIILCSFNICLAAGLIAFVLTQGGASTRSIPAQELVTRTSLSDEELWQKALQAPTAQKRFGYLVQINEPAPYRTKLEDQLENLNSNSRPKLRTWDFHQVNIKTYCQWIEADEQLEGVRQLAENKNLPLELRDAVFRNYIQKLSELDDADLLKAYKLIDLLYRESNSIAGTAIQAELFMLQKVKNAKRREILIQQINQCLSKEDSLEINQFTALGVLSQLKAPFEIDPLGSVFTQNQSERVQTRVLQLLAKQSISTNLDWLEDFSPQTPEQERLLEQVLAK